MTVHRVQGCTVQKAVVCLGEKFFASGQAYVALSRVRNLSDLVLWEFDPSAIHLEPFYQQLLQWCDNVDVIRPTLPTDVVEHPERSHDLLSNKPIPEPSMNDEQPKPGPRKCTASTEIQPKRGRGRPRKSQPVDSTQCNMSGATSNVDTSKSQAPDSIQYPKYGRGRPPKRANSDSSGQPPSKVLKLSTFSNSPSTDEPSVHSNINSACIHLLRRVQQLLGAFPQSVLTTNYTFIEFHTGGY